MILAQLAQSMLTIVPSSIGDACSFVAKHHRHSLRPQGGLFACALSDGADIVGVAIVGRPIARGLQDGVTCEVLRVCTLGAINGCSMLYGACVRAARALGYRRVVTYTLKDETGASVRAAGFVRAADVDARPSWSSSNRHRSVVIRTLFGEVEKRNTGPKVRWEWTR